MRINRINNVSFRAKLVLDKQTQAFFDNYHKKEVDLFKNKINQFGTNKDVIEIKNFEKHHTSQLVNTTGMVITRYETNGFSAEIVINDVHNKLRINESKNSRIQFPLEQIFNFIKNNSTFAECDSKIICTNSQLSDYFSSLTKK